MSVTTFIVVHGCVQADAKLASIGRVNPFEKSESSSSSYELTGH